MSLASNKYINITSSGSQIGLQGSDVYTNYAANDAKMQGGTSTCFVQATDVAVKLQQAADRYVNANADDLTMQYATNKRLQMTDTAVDLEYSATQYVKMDGTTVDMNADANQYLQLAGGAGAVTLQQADGDKILLDASGCMQYWNSGSKVLEYNGADIINYKPVNMQSQRLHTLVDPSDDATTDAVSVNWYKDMLCPGLYFAQATADESPADGAVLAFPTAEIEYGKKQITYSAADKGFTFEDGLYEIVLDADVTYSTLGGTPGVILMQEGDASDFSGTNTTVAHSTLTLSTMPQDISQACKMSKKFYYNVKGGTVYGRFVIDTAGDLESVTANTVVAIKRLSETHTPVAG